MYVDSITIFTDKYNQYLVITDEIERVVAESGIKNGVVTAQTKHTTTGITVNESLECLESDIDEFLKRMVPEDHPYVHARMLKDYGSTAGNPTGHIKALLTGNHCHFPIVEGRVVRGGAQEVYFCEFDGPSERTILIYIQGG
ncbi:secondary thiamine-phosphate synthase enzyme YjbQ [Paenibacillus sp. A14]|uniref:secondary thiamine-phosphate synthase enzyme YjbQ n=1 Tax=Paenibacillus sp. A14 TaxID=3119820 RepID=UPI002FE10281